MKIQKISHLYMYRVKLSPVIRFLFVFCITVAGTAVKPQIVKADTKPGWIVSCTFSHSLPDDPIVAFRQPGVSHLHDFVGAKTTDAFSTFTSLRVGGTTCALPGDDSAYWVPALYEDGVRILPQAKSGNNVFYYRRVGAPDGTVVQPIPPGLKILIGNAKAMSPQENPGLGDTIFFKCGPEEDGPHLPYPPTQCDMGIMVMSFTFPNCWDGVNLDSADHRSHMSYPVNGRCPASHPVNLPRLESFFRYIVGTGPIGTITLGSGPYYTAHHDFFNAWHPNALQALITKCINAGIDCGENPPLPPGALLSTISGNARVGGITLSYMDGTPKTVTSSGNGTYALPVSDNWSGSVTPSHACFNFTPTSLNYSNVITNHTGENYMPTLNPSVGCTAVDVTIGGNNVGNYGVAPEKSIFDRYKINGGPVKVSSTLPILASQRAIFGASFNSIVGYPGDQLTTEYWFTSYDDMGMTTFLIIGNPHPTDTALVDVYIGGVKRNATPYSIGPGQRIFPRFGINAGPVHVVSTNGVNIFTSERTRFGKSFNEVMGYPGNQLSTEYWFTSYDDTGMITYLVIGNPHPTDTAEVDVYIAGNKMNTTPYSIAPGQRIFPRYGINAGPVQVVSTNGVDIFTSERSKFGNTFNEVMGYPANQLATEYWFTSYDDVGMITYLVIGNPHPTLTAEVDVYINGVKKNLTTYSIAPGQRVFPRYAINGGPVRVVSTNGVDIFTSERARYLSSFNEILGLPDNQLATDYWFTSYDDLGMTAYLIIAAP